MKTLAAILLLASLPLAAQANPYAATKAKCEMLQPKNLNDKRRLPAHRGKTFFDLCHKADETTPPELRITAPHVLPQSIGLCCEGLHYGARKEVLTHECGPKGWPSIRRLKNGGKLVSPPSEVFECERAATRTCRKSPGGSKICLPEGTLN